MDADRTAVIEAVENAMEAEEKARRFYAESAAKTSHPRGRDLLEQLADFEKAHYDKLAELRASLSEDGAYVAYEGTRFRDLPPMPETGRRPEANLDEVLDILRLAIDAETRAGRRYAELAEQTEDPDGRAMFRRLAEEETLHRRILSDEFYQLTNAGGLWVWGE